VADFYCAQRKVVIGALAEEGILRFTNIEVMRQFEAMCQRIEEVLSSMTDP
jgi:very-short-patch-repair endonuclease